MQAIQAAQPLLTETSAWRVSILVCVIGAAALIGIVAFGLFIYRGRLSWRRPEFLWDDLIERLLRHQPEFAVGSLVNAYTEELQRRNEFWTSYGQIIVAVLMIIVLTILLVTRTISAEAGLPILSGISGFAIAKGVSGSRSGPQTGQRG